MLNAIDLLSRFSRSVLGITALSVINTSFQRGGSNLESSDQPLQRFVLAQLSEETAQAVMDARIGLQYPAKTGC